ncbi:hypothetical protein LC612_31080 [Nostoc sp. CHAB 5834]|nr:hypothetical protein [Nostoc sp. CHAB 5834]
MDIHQDIKSIIDFLSGLGLPPISVAPFHSTLIKVDKDGKISPRFNGKNPSFIDEKGNFREINHGVYKTVKPSRAILDSWFQSDLVGIGTLGGVNQLYWIDIDKKDFNNQEDCDRFYSSLLDTYPTLKTTWIDKTKNGGYHILVKVLTVPTLTNVGHVNHPKRLGEFIGVGRFVVTTPTVGYVNIKFPSSIADIPEFETLESLGFCKPVTESKEPKAPKSNVVQMPGIAAKEVESRSFSIERLISKKTLDILRGKTESDDRSGDLATFIKEAYGWDNWLKSQGHQVLDSPQSLTISCADVLGIESSRVERITQSVNTVTCLPALHYIKGDQGCLNKINNLREKYNVVTTAEQTILEDLFGGSDGDYVVIDSVFYYYTCLGYWKALDDESVQKLIVDELQKLFKIKVGKGGSVSKEYTFATEHNKVACFKFCRTALRILPERQKRSYRCFQDCTVDMSTGEVLKHSKEHFLTSRINFSYVANLPIPKVFKSFLDRSFAEEFHEVIRAGIAMYLDPTEYYSKFFYIMGETGSGKGTLIQLIQHLIGDDSTAYIPKLDILSNVDKCHQKLSGKTLLFNEDFGGFQSDLGAFYSLTENMPHSGRALFSSNEYTKQWFVRFLFGSTEYANLENAGAGFLRRCIQLKTLGQIPDKEKNTKLKDKLKEESASIISWALGLDREKRHGLLNTYTCEAMRRLKVNQQVASDSVSAFVDETLIPSKSRIKTSNDLIYEWYKVYAKHTGVKQLGKNKFIDRLIKTLPMCRVERQKVDGVWVPAYWVGFRQESFEKGQGEEWICKQTSEGYLHVFLNPEDMEHDEVIEITSPLEALEETKEPENLFEYASIEDGVKDLWKSEEQLGAYLHEIGEQKREDYFLNSILKKECIDYLKNIYKNFAGNHSF